ncbi:cupredoxin domain-containing protein [Parafrankia elaeagni]|uniref:cupredoxin domain-containing protein n=1 Tax=Parafrankia elaeagni TaxID=222534 RepID=UPI000373994D|nr:cupredoxin domain-containing protein [Parafrankia elaeagni]
MGTTGAPLRVAVAGAALALALGACSGSDDTDTAAGVTPDASAPVAATADGAGHSSSYGSHPSTTTPAVAATGAPAGGAQSATTVTIENFAFSPQTATFKVGQTVTVVNNDSAPHTWTSADGGFDTGRLEQGQSATVTFGKAGTFTVICEIHPSMTGTVTVTA